MGNCLDEPAGYQHHKQAMQMSYEGKKARRWSVCAILYYVKCDQLTSVQQAALLQGGGVKGIRLLRILVA